MKSSNEIIVDFTEFVKRVYANHMPQQSNRSGIGDYIKRLKEQLELIESEISSEKNRLIDEASADPKIDIDVLGDVLFRIVEVEHEKWMEEHKPR